MDKLVTGLVVAVVAAVGAGALAAVSIKAARGQYAQVLKVTPLTSVVRTPRQECHNENVTHQGPVKDEHQVIGTVAGAVIGGVIGHQVGGGTGRDIATVAGAAGGGYAGNRIQKNLQDRDTYTTSEQRCATVYDTSEKPAGFEVRYRLDGREGTVRMDHDPGKHIAVRDGKLILRAGGQTTS